MWVAEHTSNPKIGRAFVSNATRLVRPRSVTGNGERLVSRAGLAWLGETADLCGLTGGLIDAFAGASWRRHHPGRTMAQVILALADGATCLSDLAVLRNQPGLAGPVASEPTVWRTFEAVTSAELRGIAAARGTARQRAWAAGAGPDGEVLVIDIDATIVATKADKQDAAPTYKRSYGHHPLLAIAGDCNEVLAGMLRAGNAGANTAEDHIVVLADAIAALPAEWRVGHSPGDHRDDAAKDLVVRADAGGTSHWLVEECRHRNIGYSLGFAITGAVRDAIVCVDDDTWVPAVDGNGRARPGAEVAELTHWMDLGAWPEGTRVIVRRERPHPGAQLSLFDTVEGMRHTAFITDQPGDDIAALELFQRQRARAENVIRDTKACGLANLPFDCVVNNEIWMQLCFTAHDLLVWAQQISLTGPLRRATPKTLRHRLLHVAARTTPTGQRLDLDRTWPWTTTLLSALDHLRRAFRSLTVTTPQPAQAAL
ncbi:MAG: IS1380 family transposase [Gammaproteobacteria bacterium]|nr:IS1380 family transposase [Gammaproteobacteria bacterium]